VTRKNSKVGPKGRNLFGGPKEREQLKRRGALGNRRGHLDFFFFPRDPDSATEEGCDCFALEKVYRGGENRKLEIACLRLFGGDRVKIQKVISC